MNNEHAQFIDHLRAAAAEYWAVAELLNLIDSSLLLDWNGNREVVGSDEDIEFLKSAQIASAFSRLDRSGEDNHG